MFSFIYIYSFSNFCSHRELYYRLLIVPIQSSIARWDLFSLGKQNSVSPHSTGSKKNLNNFKVWSESIFKNFKNRILNNCNIDENKREHVISQNYSVYLCYGFGRYNYNEIFLYSCDRRGKCIHGDKFSFVVEIRDLHFLLRCTIIRRLWI